MLMTVLLIVHGLFAVALLGAITHQALAVWWPVRQRAGSFVERFRAVPSAHYVNAIVVLYLVTFVLGGIIYTHYRITVRLVIEQLELWSAHGLFELKEHFLAIGLGLLPAYWYVWQQPLAVEHVRTRAVLTAILCFIVWWSFLVGHIINNLRGFGL
jgi:ABC-type amino acid transport system permease subunit